MLPRLYIASGTSPDIAFLYHDMAMSVDGSKPNPNSYITARLNPASASPRDAAIQFHIAESLSDFDNPSIFSTLSSSR